MHRKTLVTVHAAVIGFSINAAASRATVSAQTGAIPSLEFLTGSARADVRARISERPVTGCRVTAAAIMETL